MFIPTPIPDFDHIPHTDRHSRQFSLRSPLIGQMCVSPSLWLADGDQTTRTVPDIADYPQFFGVQRKVSGAEKSPV